MTSSPETAVFAGRDDELGALSTALAQARGGEGRVVLIEGESGVGKTALIEHFLGEHPHVQVLRAGGERSERGVALGVADQLLRRGGAPGAPAAGARVLELCLRLADDEPLILVLDDAQWADAESLEAVVFALRRLDRSRVLALVASRPSAALDGVKRLAEGPTGNHLRLSAMTLDELHALAAALGREISGSAVRRLWQHTEGDLRYTRALLDELPSQAWSDVERPLPAPRELVADVAVRCSACSAATVRLVEAASVLGTGSMLFEVAELAAVEASLAALEEAASAGLLRAGRRRGLPIVEFSPPAVGAAVYEQIGPAKRASLHRTAAGIAQDETIAMLHLAAAAPGPDAALADQLDALASRRRERPDAAAALVAASRLSTTRAGGEDRLIRAVDWMLLAGDVAQARAFAGEVAASAPSARRDSVLGQLALSGDRVHDADAWLERAWQGCDPEQDPELAATIAHRNAFRALIHLRDGEVIAWARRALELAPRHPLAVEWNATLALSLWRLGRRSESRTLLDAAFSGDGDRDAPLAGMRAWLRIAGDDLEGARDALAAAADTELRLGAREIGVVHLNVLARAHFEVGAWDDAVAVADRAVALASQLEDVSARVFVWWAAALVPAARGDWRVAHRFAQRAAAEPTDAPDRIVAVAIARAVPAAARADFATVITALEPLAAITPGAAVDEPGFWPWQHLHGDALVAAGRLDEAAAFLDHHEPLAAEREHQTAAARLGIVRGRLEAARGERARAEAAFGQALERLAPLARPFDIARARLALGQFLRRDGRRRAAAAQLSAAAEAFEALGARPALERTQRELEASGLHPGPRGPDSGGRLTPQEITVARLVASGHTNREVAVDLQLSVKTVEVHLTRIYAKLGIGSRTQLARHLP